MSTVWLWQLVVLKATVVSPQGGGVDCSAETRRSVRFVLTVYFGFFAGPARAGCSV